VVTPDDIDAELKRIGHTLRRSRSSWSTPVRAATTGKTDYLLRGCGMGRDATLHLLQQGIRVTGTDAWSWDAPFAHTARRFAETGDGSIIWEGHKAGREIGYCHIESCTT